MTKKQRMQDPQDILAQYKKDLERWRTRGTQHKDTQALIVPEVFYFRSVIHPTNKKESKALTKELIEFLCTREICTAQDIYDAFGYSDKPVLKRLKIFKQFGFIRRESKKWYMATPRMHELRKKYLRRVCS